MNSEKYAWQFETQAEQGLDGRKLHCPRGKVLGGSSSINGIPTIFCTAHMALYRKFKICALF